MVGTAIGITIKLHEARWNVGKDRVERIWRREGPKVPQKLHGKTATVKASTLSCATSS